MSEFIAPRVLKGFRDYLPAAEGARGALIQKLEASFSSFGFVPIDTPALEYAEILLGKGGGETDKQVYRFLDNGNRDVALRFDLTVPFARFMAEHVDELYLPFRRYHIAKVWRGENTQRGRYREFMQCDFDIVGVDCASADADIVLTIADAMRRLCVGDVRIRINHRTMFNRFLWACGAEGSGVAVLRIVDKLEKIGKEETKALLSEEVGTETAGKVLSFIEPKEGFLETLQAMLTFCAPDDVMAMDAAKRLEDVYNIAHISGNAESLVLDPSITRGLDYYTGIVFETNLVEMPEIGSVCSGGRYNELASLYTSRKLPGVGASVGLDRLLAALELLGKTPRSGSGPKVLLLCGDAVLLPALHKIATSLRAAGVATEVYPEAKKASAQYGYAEKKAIPFALALDEDSLSRGTFPLRNLAERITTEYDSLEAVVAHLGRTE